MITIIVSLFMTIHSQTKLEALSKLVTEIDNCADDDDGGAGDDVDDAVGDFDGDDDGDDDDDSDGDGDDWVG